MPLHRSSNLPSSSLLRNRNFSKRRIPVLSLLFISVLAPLVFLASHSGNVIWSFGRREFLDLDGTADTVKEHRTLNTLNRIESLFPKEVISVITANTDDKGPFSLNTASMKGLSSSWVVEKHHDFSSENSDKSAEVVNMEKGKFIVDSHGINARSAMGRVLVEDRESWKAQEQLGSLKDLPVNNSQHSIPTDKTSPAQSTRHRLRNERRVKRLRELTQQDDAVAARLENEAMDRIRDIGSDNVLSKYSIWRQDGDESSDSLVRLMRDQLIMARVYAGIAQSHNQAQLLRDLRLRIKENQRALGEANLDVDLPRSASERVKAMGQMLSRARQQLYDCAGITKKLRAMLQSSEEQARVLRKQSTFLSQLAAKTLPKGIHCLSMRLTTEYYGLPEDQREFSGRDKLEDNNLFHYALFTDNVLAASVVVNSTIHNAKEPWKHVFHLVTDKLNYASMRMWFLANPPGNATIEVQNIDEFSWLNSSYCPVLQQLESAAMKEYYFKADHPTTIAAGSSNLKYRNPKYLSMLNHLRFYLPQVYPKLDKSLFLDDDIVVQKDLTSLWSVNLGGKVNGAVETCGHSFHRFDKYLNFSNPHIKRNFDPRACGWAYGMNIFDLRRWKERDITGIYHRWQSMNEGRILWKLGTLPPGLITFYNLTHPLRKSWHVLGLGYNPAVDRGEIDGAAVIHYNGNMKPWLELAIAKYKNYWARYVKYDHYFLQQCNINQ